MEIKYVETLLKMATEDLRQEVFPSPKVQVLIKFFLKLSDTDKESFVQNNVELCSILLKLMYTYKRELMTHKVIALYLMFGKMD